MGVCKGKLPTNNYIEYYGQQYTLAEMGRRFGKNGVDGPIFIGRIRKGWDVDVALDYPPMEARGAGTREKYYQKHHLITKPAIISPIEFDPSLIKDEYKKDNKYDDDKK